MFKSDWLVLSMRRPVHFLSIQVRALLDCVQIIKTDDLTAIMPLIVERVPRKFIILYVTFCNLTCVLLGLYKRLICSKNALIAGVIMLHINQDYHEKHSQHFLLGRQLLYTKGNCK